MKEYTIVLLIRHPKMRYDDISTELGLEPHTAWNVGDRIKTPKGRELPGRRELTSWSHLSEFRTEEPFFEEIERVVLKLKSNHSEFIKRISEEGGHAEIFIRLPGHMYQGSSMKPSTLKIISELGLHLGVEVFPEVEVDTSRRKPKRL